LGKENITRVGFGGRLLDRKKKQKKSDFKKKKKKTKKKGLTSNRGGLEYGEGALGIILEKKRGKKGINPRGGNTPFGQKRGGRKEKWRDPKKE